MPKNFFTINLHDEQSICASAHYFITLIYAVIIVFKFSFLLSCLWFHVELILSSFKSDVMFRGEAASLKAMYETNTVRVPKPIDVVNLGGT